MKKAVIKTGSKQYLVSENEQIEVELLKTDKKSIEFIPLLVVDGDNVQIGKPALDKIKVIADIVEADVQTDKVTSIRFKAKKRVRTVKGHRQHKSIIKIKKIA